MTIAVGRGYRAGMPADTSHRLVSLVRRADADLAEAALLCATGCDAEVDVAVQLLRIDALADQLRNGAGALPGGEAAARTLGHHLGTALGFRGDPARFHDPDSSLLHRVLDSRQGLPITLSIVYVAIARRLGIAAWPIALPGHVVVGVADDDRPMVLDPYHGGRVLDEEELSDRVRDATDGRLAYRRAMLRPTPAVAIVRRLLNNLTRDLIAAQRPGTALWTVEVKLALPNHVPDDHRQRGELATATGRFDTAATAFERYLELTSGDTGQRQRARRAAIEARARMN